MTRTIRSFVCRAGRISPRQQYALDTLLTNYTLDVSQQTWDLAAIFQRTAETIVEIGFGMGASLVEMAKVFPEKNFIGIEVHRPGIGSLVADVHDAGLTNVRVVAHDAVQVFSQCLPAGALAGIQVFFPDPWPKKRHHKRRLIQASFLDLVLPSLQKGGFIHCATDWQEYAEHMMTVLTADTHLINQEGAGLFAARPATRPITKFERRGQRLGHGVWDLIFLKD